MTFGAKSYEPTYDARTSRRSTTTSGPAPRRSAPFNRNRFHYNWHWFWDTGNGDLGNQGIHEVDIARWGLGVTHPTKVSAIGGKFMFDDDQETPNTIIRELRVRRRRQEEDDDLRGAALDLAARSGHQRREARQHDRQSVLRLEGLPRHRQLQQVPTRSWARTRRPGPTATKGDEHWANFIDAVRSRKRQDLNAEVEEGALSCNLMHLANISYRVGRTLHWDAEDDDVRRRHGGQQDADPRVPRAVRRAEDRLT